MREAERETDVTLSGTAGATRLGQDHGSAGLPVPGTGDEWQVGDWPPASYAENDHILVWWLPEYDDMLRELVAAYQWAWRSAVLPRLEIAVPEKVIRAWRETDPLCRDWSWYQVLDTFTAARAKQLGIQPRPPRPIVCSCCSGEFLESHLTYTYIARVGVDAIDVCGTCLGQALYQKGSLTSAPEAVIAVLQTLSRALQRPAIGTDLGGRRLNLQALSPGARAEVIQALRVKPTLGRVKELFGSWDEAVSRAAEAPPAALPPYEPPPMEPMVRVDPAFSSEDPARYQPAEGPLPNVKLDPGRDSRAYCDEVLSLIGTGYLALAEAALTKLLEQRPSDDSAFYASCLLAQVHAETARLETARTTINQLLPPGQPEHPVIHRPRDLRTITTGPVFYRPLPRPRGNARFVLVGGPMDYVDPRGEHTCVTGQPPDGGAANELAESVARMSAMVDGAPWIEAATNTGRSLMASLARAGGDERPYGHLVCYLTTPFRDAVKATTGAWPKKVAEDIWRIGSAGKTGWSYQRDAGRYVHNANAGYTYITVETAPAICIWGWPDRSDLCLQAFTDTVAAASLDPVTVILPDVPAFRDFARRYVRGERMDRVSRTLMEECLYRGPNEMKHKRGIVLTAEFAPQLVVHSDGTEDGGAALASALAYLDAHHTLRLSAWDVLADPLLREAATATAAPTSRFSVPAGLEREEMVRWTTRYADDELNGALLSLYRPTLLDAVTPA
jgi:hypothetical protein